MNRFRTILSAFLLLGVGSAIYLWWRLSDEQVVLRRVDALCETVSVRTLSLGDRDRPLEIFRSLVDDRITVSGDPMIPNGTFSREEAVKRVESFRTAARSADVRRLDTAVTFPGPDRAVVETILEVETHLHGRSRTLDRTRAQLHFRRAPEGWILTEAQFREAAGK